MSDDNAGSAHAKNSTANDSRNVDQLRRSRLHIFQSTVEGDNIYWLGNKIIHPAFYTAMSLFIQGVPADSDEVHTFSTKVRDEGLGIKEQRMNQLFEPFPRLRAGDINVQGTGIGLTITKNLAVLMGGESSPGPSMVLAVRFR